MNTQVIDDLLGRTIEFARSLKRTPQSTYRLQLHKDFTFRDATAIVPYLADLGVSHVYASPYFKAKPGSMHGYDVIDHSQLNPELGSQADFDAFLAALASHGMSHILDFVPNHVGVATNDNAWWNDVLENGRASRFASYFDITWGGSPLNDLKDRLLLPLLGGAYGDVLEKGELKVVFADGGFLVTYFDRRFPISPRTYGSILMLHDGKPLPRELQTIIERCGGLCDRCETASVADERHTAKEQIQSDLRRLYAGDAAARAVIDEGLCTINGRPGEAASFDRLDALLRAQHYRLASWRTGPDEINYRRFFDVNDLAAIAMERPEVFEATHRLALSLMAGGHASGLRIDHPDGLFDPAAYFDRLQTHFLLAIAKRVAADRPELREQPWDELREQLLPRLRDTIRPPYPLYVLGEKILAMNEAIPTDWPIDGTSGYDFLNTTNGLFVDARNADAFTRLYHEWIDDETPFEELIYQKKKLILEIALASELHMLALELKRLASRERHSLDFTLSGLSAALKEVIACFPVYRSYITAAGVSETDRERIVHAVETATAKNPLIDGAIFDFIRQTLFLTFGERCSEQDRALQRHFAGKFQQLTSPTTAKGIEDTAFYIYNRLLSLNEVGGDPAMFGVSPKQLHAFYQHRQRNWPASMSTLSTHDTKRSEDVRARLNALSEMPDQWNACLERWAALNAHHRSSTADGRAIPDRNDEYAIYQTLLGAWPEVGDSHTTFAAFIERVQAYTLKAMRESKVHTIWIRPDTEYEAGVKHFLDAVLDQSQSPEFWGDFIPFQRELARRGHHNSLAQTVLKLTAPGVPDTYQGTEFWDDSLVDPDNRRPIDYRPRMDAIRTAGNGRSLETDDRKCKAQVTRTLLQLRKERPTLFSDGEYIPLETRGALADTLFAFGRKTATDFLLVVVKRFTGEREEPSAASAAAEVLLPKGIKSLTLVDALNGGGKRVESDRLSLADFPMHGSWLVLVSSPPGSAAPSSHNGN